MQQQDRWGRLVYYSNGSPVLVPHEKAVLGKDRAASAIWGVFWLQVAIAVFLVFLIASGGV